MKQSTTILWLLLTPSVLSARPLILTDEAGLTHQLFDSASGWLICLSLTLGIVAICMQLFRARRQVSGSQRNGSGTILRELQEDIMRFKDKLHERPTMNDFNSLLERVKALEGQWMTKESFSREISWEGDDIQRTIAAERTAPEKTANPIVSDQPLVQQETFYAKMADLENGFSPNIITKHQDGEQLFEILEQEDRAIYKITDDVNAQRYALAEPSMLSRACELLNQPFKGCLIVMRSAGILHKAGDQWHIQSKAKIEFK